MITLSFNQVVGNSLKSLEVSEEKANQRVEEFKRQLKSLTAKLKEAENRAELAEKTVKKLQKEVDRLEGKFIGCDPKATFFCFSSAFLRFEHNFFWNENKFHAVLKTTSIRDRRKCDQRSNYLLHHNFRLKFNQNDQKKINTFFGCQQQNSIFLLFFNHFQEFLRKK